MNSRIASVVAALAMQCALLAGPASAHPASGIVVDDKGEIFFVYSGHGVMKIERDGKITCIHPSKGGHWMCLDEDGSFADVQPKYFERVTPAGVKPAIIFADGGAPIAVCRDGNLYYGSGTETQELSPGGLSVTRMTPEGKLTAFTPGLKKRLAEFDDGVAGLADGPDGSLYVACWSGVLKVNMDGAVTTLVHPIVVSDCDRDPPDHGASNHKPCLRGLAVDPHGTVYAAATSCHRVVKITPDGQVTTILKAERPWSPTGVAWHDRQLYVLEYTNANGGPNEDGGWRPRVRKVGRDGKVTTLATMTR